MEKHGIEANKDEAITTLRKTVESIRIEMLNTFTADRQIRSRPLYTAEMDEDGGLWFLVASVGPKINEIYSQSGHVGVSYVDHAHEYYVSLTGTARLVDDRRKKADLWGPVAEAWFPGGKDNASVSLLHIVPERGEYWAGPRTTVGQLFAFARAAVTGNTESFGDNKKFKLS